MPSSPQRGDSNGVDIIECFRHDIRVNTAKLTFNFPPLIVLTKEDISPKGWRYDCLFGLYCKSECDPSHKNAVSTGIKEC